MARFPVAWLDDSLFSHCLSPINGASDALSHAPALFVDGLAIFFKLSLKFWMVACVNDERATFSTHNARAGDR